MLGTSLLVNLSYFDTILKQDKENYVFENSLFVVKQLRTEIEGQISSATKDIELYSNLLFFSSTRWEQLFQKQTLIDGFKLFSQGDQSVYIRKNFLEKDKSYQIELKELLNRESSFPDFGFSFERVEEEDSLLVTYQDLEKNRIKYVVNMSELFQRMSVDKLHEYLIYDLDGRVIFSSVESDIEAGLIKQLIDVKGTGSQLISFEKRKLLSSYSIITSLGIGVVILTDSNKAYAAIQWLSNRVLGVGLILIGAALILGLYFSYKVSSPIIQLEEAAGRVAQGDFTSQVSIISGDELESLGDSFNSMARDIEDYSRNLEQKVEDRTRELSEAHNFINTMINSIDQGLMVLDQNLTCYGTHSVACERIFGKNPEGLSLADIVEYEGQQVDTLEKWKKLLAVESLSFDMRVGLGPKSITLKRKEGDKYIEFSYFQMKNTSNLQDLVVVATDKTREEASRKELRRKNSYVDMIFKILQNRQAFNNFMAEVDARVDQIRSNLVANHPLEKSRILFHTLSGSFGIYSVNNLAEQTQKIELLLKDSDLSDASIRQEIIDSANEFFIDYQKFKKDLYQAILNEQTSYELTELEANAIKNAIKNEDLIKLKELTTDIFEMISLNEILSPYRHLVKNLASHIQKEVQDLKINGGKIRINSKKYADFFTELVHLFRNCLDHGLEDPEERAATRKPSQGLIQVSGVKEAGKLILTIKDDGRGIDYEKLKLHPMAKDLESDEELGQLIFLEDVSTAKKDSQLSGLGVGMSALKDAVIKLDGEIRVHSVRGEGTTFTFII